MKPFARTIDAAKKYVVSSTLVRSMERGARARGSRERRSAAQAGVGKGLLVGGVKLSLALAELGLIDEYEFVVQPRLAGHGPTLFAGLSKYVDFRRLGSALEDVRCRPTISCRFCRIRFLLTPGDKMPRQIVYTPKAAKPPATYSQAVKAAGLVFVSGTAPHDPADGQIKGATIQEQTRQCLTNIAAILEEAGSSLDKIVSVTIVLADEEDFAGMNEEWLRWFPGNPPARQGAKLPAKVPGLKVSIAVIAEA